MVTVTIRGAAYEIIEMRSPKKGDTILNAILQVDTVQNDLNLNHEMAILRRLDALEQEKQQ